ncbi:MAG: TIGR03435 family protein [Acidobacteriia bacterium]|nr:TIGR03435 family protein [Terriglobia bacterium]
MRALAWIGFAALLASAVFAQTSATAPQFEKADIHPSSPNTILEMRSRFFRGRYELRTAALVDLIRTAWGVDADQVVGGPDWLDTDRFDVIAMAPADSTPENLKGMLRRLLVDRFHLAAHEETRLRPAYVMTVDKKPRLQPADGDEATGCGIQPSQTPPSRGAAAAPVALACRNMTMAAFAKTLPHLREASGYLFDYPVEDRTGLKGAWNYTLTWSPRLALRANREAADTITIFSAFEKQLGLKLERSNVPAPVVVVDSVNEKPTGNLPEAAEKPAAPLEFEVAEIKPDDPNRQGASVSIQPGGRVRMTMSLQGLIQEAWGAIGPNRIVGGPKFIDTARFVVEAKAPAQEDAVSGWNGPVWNGVDIDSMRQMLRALLVDRFQLATHQEDRLVTGYELVARRPKLRKADPAHRPGCKEGPGADGKDPRLTNPVASRLITCRNMSLAQFAAQLNQLFIELPPVMDSTGIAGRYDMTLNFSPQAAIENLGVPRAGGDAVASDPNGAISFSEALSRQLGLKLEPRTVTAPMLVIDQVNETPTEN